MLNGSSSAARQSGVWQSKFKIKNECVFSVHLRLYKCIMKYSSRSAYISGNCAFNSKWQELQDHRLLLVTQLSPLLLTRLVRWCSRSGPSRVWRRRWLPHLSLARLQHPWASPQTLQGSSHQVWDPHSEGSYLPEPQCEPDPVTEAGGGGTTSQPLERDTPLITVLFLYSFLAVKNKMTDTSQA